MNRPPAIAARWTPLNAGALLRLSLGTPARLSVAWACPARGAWATGVGIAAESDADVQWENGVPEGLPGPWFGGWTYSGAERWVLPKVLAWWHGGRTYAAVFGAPLIDAISEAEPAGATSCEVRAGDRAGWTALVEAALAEIATGRLAKVVLARRIEAVGTFDERKVLKALEARYPACRTFLLRDGDAAFVGASPETLCRVEGRALETEALAGTGKDEALLSSAKDLREHAWVTEAIVEGLRPLCTAIAVAPEPRLKRLANVVHLCTPIHATLRDGVEAITAARALHPTPAVGGTPRAAAVAFQQKHEGFDRGWYAGAIGARGRESLELCVGIRSARVAATSATVFTGAGIVAGSTPDAEWEETERKAKAVLGALDG